MGCLTTWGVVGSHLLQCRYLSAFFKNLAINHNLVTGSWRSRYGCDRASPSCEQGNLAAMDRLGEFPRLLSVNDWVITSGWSVSLPTA